MENRMANRFDDMLNDTLELVETMLDITKRQYSIRIHSNTDSAGTIYYSVMIYPKSGTGYYTTEEFEHTTLNAAISDAYRWCIEEHIPFLQMRGDNNDNLDG